MLFIILATCFFLLKIRCLPISTQNTGIISFNGSYLIFILVNRYGIAACLFRVL